MSHRRAALIAAAIALLTTNPLGAQGLLDSLVTEALAHNLSLSQQRLADQQAELDVKRAKSLYFPTLGLDARYTEVSGGLDFGDLINPAYAALNQLTGTDAFPTDISLVLPFKQDMRVRLSQPIYDGSIQANYALSRAQREIAAGRLGAAARDVAAGVQLAWLQHAAADRVVAVYEATLALIEENLRVNEVLVANGKATPEVVYRARADRSEAEQRIADARQRRDAAGRAFNQVMGRPLDAPVPVLADSLPDAPLTITLDSALQVALTHRDELREADGGIKAAHAETRLATASMLPNLGLAVDYGFQGNELAFDANNDFVAAAVVVQWSLFTSGRNQTRRQQAKLGTAQATIARANLVRQITEQVQQAFEAASVSHAAISTAGDRLAAARRTFELARRRYEEGMAPQLELTDARTEYTNAGLNEVLTRYSYASRRVELERAAALRTIEPAVEGNQP